jgi:S-adenosylmethionine synthetase
MEDHCSQDRRQKKKKKVKIYTYRTATGSAIETAAPRLVITATGSTIENAEAGSVGELKCRIVVSDRRTHRLPELI